MSLLKSQSWWLKKTKKRPNRALIWSDTFRDGVLVIWPANQSQMLSEINRLLDGPKVSEKDFGDVEHGSFISHEGLHFIVFPNKRPSVGVIAHESVHFVNHMLDDKGVKSDPDNDETHAYMVQWVVDRIYEITRK